MSKQYDQLSLRARSSVVMSGITWAVIAAVIGADIWANGWQSAWRLASVGAVIAVWVWWLQWYPQFTILRGAEGLLVRNPASTVLIPWAALVHIDARHTLTLVTPGRRTAVWAAPSPGRAQPVAGKRSDLERMPDLVTQQGAAARSQQASLSATAAEQVTARWQAMVEAGEIEAGIADETPVTARRNTVAIIVVAVLTVAAVLALAIG